LRLKSLERFYAIYPAFQRAVARIQFFSRKIRKKPVFLLFFCIRQCDGTSGMNGRQDGVADDFLRLLQKNQAAFKAA